MKIDFSKLSQRQISNLKSAIRAYDNREVTSSASPPVLYIELTQNCISQCAFCKRGWSNDHSYNMDSKIFEVLLRDYVPCAVFVSLGGWGESLMLPNVDQSINKISQHGVKIGLTTTLGCGDKKALQSLIDNDVFISISFDAADKILYEKIRKGVSYDTVIKNIEFLTKEMKKKGTLKDNIKLAIAPLQNLNLKQINKIITLAKYYGISKVTLTPLSAWPIHFDLLRYHKAKTVKMLHKCVEYSRSKNIKLQLITNPFKKFCIKDKIFDLCCHPWLYFFVNYKGDALPCDHMLRPFHMKHALGHISQHKEDVWNGDRAQKNRFNHIKKNIKGLPDICNNCYMNGRYADHEHEINDQFGKWLVEGKELGDRLETLRGTKFKPLFKLS